MVTDLNMATNLFVWKITPLNPPVWFELRASADLFGGKQAVTSALEPARVGLASHSSSLGWRERVLVT